MRTIGSDITIFNAAGVQITKAPFASGSTQKAELMKEDYITIKIVYEALVAFGIGCYVIYGGKKFILRKAYEPDRTSENYYSYELKFEAEWMHLGDLIFFYTKTGIKEAEWSLTGNPSAFMQLIVDYAKATTGLNYILGTVTPTVSITVQFSSTNILDALTDIAKACSEAESYTTQAEWWFDGLTLNLTRCEFGTIVDFVEGNAVQRMEPQKSDSDEEFTRLYAFGSTRNIPADYRAGSQDTLYANISKRLRLPVGTPYIDSKEGLTDDEVVEVVKLFEEIYPREIIPITGVIQSNETDENDIGYKKFYIRQDTLNFSNDYLTNETLSLTFRTGKLAGRTFEIRYLETLGEARAFSLFKTNVFETWKTKILEWNNANSADKPQTFEAWLVARNNLLVSNAKAYHNNPAWNGTAADFVEEMFNYWANVAKTVWNLNDPAVTMFNYTTSTGAFDNVSRVAFASWKSMLAACTFAYDWNHALNIDWSYEASMYAYPEMCETAETVHDNAYSEGGLFEIINTANGTTYLPNEVLCPEVGATFILFNFDISLVSSQYIPDAENELLAAAQEYMAYKLSNKKNYSCPTNSPYCARNAIDLQIGRKVRLHGSVFGTYRDSRVFSFEKALDTPGKATYLIGDSSNYSRSKALDSKVDVLISSAYNQGINTANQILKAIGSIKVGVVNLLRNSGFTGDYTSEQLTENTNLTENTEMYSSQLKYWDGSATIKTDPNSASGFSVLLGFITQVVTLIVGENYILSFKAKGESVSASVCGYESIRTLTDTYEKCVMKFTAGAGTALLLSGNCTVCEIQLERGSVPTDWASSPLDNDKSLDSMQLVSHVLSAIKDGSVSAIGGLVLASMMQVGNYKNGLLQNVTAGMSGVFTDVEDPAFWGGGTFTDAIKAIINPDDASGAPFAVSHGGLLIANNAVIRGTIRALAGMIGGCILKGDRMTSQAKDAEGNPFFDLNGKTGSIDIKGKFSSSANGRRVVIDPATQSLKEYDSLNRVIVAVEFGTDSENTYSDGRIRVYNYVGESTTPSSSVHLSGGQIIMYKGSVEVFNIFLHTSLGTDYVAPWINLNLLHTSAYVAGGKPAGGFVYRNGNNLCISTP